MATTTRILESMKDKGLIHHDCRTLSEKEEKARRAIGRKLANIVGFQCTKKYDPYTKQDRNFWR
jgi:hypothetical protein